MATRFPAELNVQQNRQGMGDSQEKNVLQSAEIIVWQSGRPIATGASIKMLRVIRIGPYADTGQRTSRGTLTGWQDDFHRRDKTVFDVVETLILKAVSISV